MEKRKRAKNSNIDINSLGIQSLFRSVPSNLLLADFFGVSSTVISHKRNELRKIRQDIPVGGNWSLENARSIYGRIMEHIAKAHGISKQLKLKLEVAKPKAEVQDNAKKTFSWTPKANAIVLKYTVEEAAKMLGIDKKSVGSQKWKIKTNYNGRNYVIGDLNEPVITTEVKEEKLPLLKTENNKVEETLFKNESNITTLNINGNWIVGDVDEVRKLLDIKK